MSLSSVSTLKLTSPHLAASTGAAVVVVEVEMEVTSSVLQHTPALRVSARRHRVGKYLCTQTQSL